MLNGIAPSPKTFAGVERITKGADLTVANLEIPLTTARTPTLRKTAEELRRKDQWVLKADPRHGQHLASSGFDLVSLANNHAMDFGPAGLTQMTRTLEAVGIAYAGAGRHLNDALRPTIVTLPNGKRVGLISGMAFVTTAALQKVTPATPKEPGVNGLTFDGVIGTRARLRLGRYVAAAKRQCEFLIVGLHWGVERKQIPSRYQVDLGRAFAEAGADLVWGHHPHVLQGAELYRGVPILYSMGNLISPLPAQTGFARFSFGRQITFDFLPARIRAGRVSALTGREAVAARIEFARLCGEVQRCYPDEHSRNPFPTPVQPSARVIR